MIPLTRMSRHKCVANIHTNPPFHLRVFRLLPHSSHSTLMHVPYAYLVLCLLPVDQKLRGECRINLRDSCVCHCFSLPLNFLFIRAFFVSLESEKKSQPHFFHWLQLPALRQWPEIASKATTKTKIHCLFSSLIGGCFASFYLCML